MNMRKVAIITLYDSNIGNRLQNYALQRILERHGFDAYTYWYSLKLSYIQKIKRINKMSHLMDIQFSSPIQKG